MEEEEEEVLGYLDRVLEEDDLFDYGDGELDAGAPVHSQFKVRRQGARYMAWKTSAGP